MNIWHDTLQSDDEKRVCDSLLSKSRKKWMDMLLEANECLEEADSLEEEDVIRIAENTQMRVIYPMLHTSFKLNFEHAEAYPEAVSGICFRDLVMQRTL